MFRMSMLCTRIARSLGVNSTPGLDLCHDRLMDDDVTFLDALNPLAERVSRMVRAERLRECRSCDRFIALTSQCRECGCFMVAKTTLARAECPLGRWNAVVSPAP